MPVPTVPDTINGVIDREQGFVNNPNDRGGPTCWGITERVARAHGYTGSMKDMSRKFAFDVYFNTYYTAPNFGLILARLYPLGVALTDAGVLCGTGTVSKWLQIVLNVLNRDQKTYKDIGVDGNIGPATSAAMNSFLTARGKDGEKVLLQMFKTMLGAHFIEISIERPQNEEFIYGWFLNRMNVE